jgi:homoserine kinase
MPGVVAAGQSLTVTVPATSANLGPGFDTLGLAVSLHDTVRVRTNATGTTSVRAAGEGSAGLPTDGTHLVARTVLGTLAEAGYACPGLELETENAIPHGRGLGSSAAAIVSGVVAANALLPAGARMDGPAMLQLCATLEGHPDNVAPALTGSLAISWEDDGVYRTARAAVHPDIIPVAAVPEAELSTERARGLLPASVSHRDAAANAGRAALLVHALRHEPEHLLAGTRDRLHQDYRAGAMAPSAELVAHLRQRGYAAVVSGAGPTVMTFAVGAEQARTVEQEIRAATGQSGSSWRVLRLEVAAEGAKVEVHQR